MEEVTVVDEPAAARRIADVCERRGFSTHVVHGEVVTVDDLETTSCVVTEVGVDGTTPGVDDSDPLAFADRIRREQPETAIVVYTDEGSEAIASRAFSVGVDEYVRKSAGATALSEAVERAIERRRSRLPATSGASAAQLTRYRTIVETVDDMIYALDASGSVTLANHAFVGYFGLAPDEMVGTAIAELMPETGYETGTELIRTLLSTEQTNRGRFDFELERPDGSTSFLEVNVTLVCEGEEFLGSVGVVRDVTERRKRSQQLERQNERLEAFASIVGHDLRNPLNVIAGSADAARDSEPAAHLDRIETCVDRMDAMLTDLLALAREGKRLDEVEPVSLESVAIDAWQTVDTGDANLRLDEELGSVEADRGRLRQCLENLFRNAVEHSSTSPATNARRDAPEHDSVTAGSRSHPDAGDRESTTARVQSDWEGAPSTLMVSVEAAESGFAVCDDGPGVPDSEAEQVFERGYTTSRDGTGFGLSIVSQIVEAHGWSIRLDREYEAGARFVIET